ncbi:MAG TPA: serine hydrolase [Ginsengibacter sp.]
MKNIITSLICLFLLSIPSEFLYCQSTADSLLNFVKLNKTRSSLFLRKNDTVIAQLNEDKLMPLASTVKIIVAIEFAKQAAHNVFNENERIPLSELEKYYLPYTDGGAHPRWISYEKNLGNIINDSVKLIDVARGMIIFSSNANTEYLMDLLGFDNVQNNIQLLGLKKHTPIYPLVSSLFMYQNPKKVSEDKVLKEIEKLNDEDYAKAAFLIHRELKNDSNYKKKFRPLDLTLKMQKEWSDRLPASTTKEYVQLCSILNNRKYFDDNTYHVLANVLETLMENPGNQTWLSHAGMKGGSTIFVLTKALYATLKNGTKIEMAYFFNDLTGEENARLQKWMNDFEIKVLTDENFRKQIVF